MRLPQFLGFSLLVLLSCSGSEWEDLYQPDKTNFRITGTSTWSWEDGILTASGDTTLSYMISKSSYRNFELELEFYPDDEVNSGIFIRCTEEEMSDETCYEINIWDLHPIPEWRTGAIVKRADPLNYVETNNKWNTYRIRAEDTSIKAWINGVLVADIIDEELPEGTIGLQRGRKGKIKFRNIKIRSL